MAKAYHCNKVILFTQPEIIEGGQKEIYKEREMHNYVHSFHNLGWIESKKYYTHSKYRS